MISFYSSDLSIVTREFALTINVNPKKRIIDTYRKVYVLENDIWIKIVYIFDHKDLSGVGFPYDLIELNRLADNWGYIVEYTPGRIYDIDVPHEVLRTFRSPNWEWNEEIK